MGHFGTFRIGHLEILDYQVTQIFQVLIYLITLYSIKKSPPISSEKS